MPTQLSHGFRVAPFSLPATASTFVRLVSVYACISVLEKNAKLLSRTKMAP